MSELFDRWLEHVEGQPSPTTAREYRRLVAKMLGPALGHLPLRKITTHRIDEFYTELSREKRLSPGTIRHAHAVVRGALGQAHKWGWIPSNPAVAVSLPRARRKEITPPAITDMRALLAEADARDPDFGALLRVLTATGARRGEVCGLRWTDLDQHAGTLFIRRSKDRTRRRDLVHPRASSHATGPAGRGVPRRVR